MTFSLPMVLSLNTLRFSRTEDLRGKKQLLLSKVRITCRSFRTHLLTVINIAGQASGIFFGIPWITHPDLAQRLQFGKPLDNEIDYVTLYGKYYAPEVEQRKGYVDYPAADYSHLELKQKSSKRSSILGTRLLTLLRRGPHRADNSQS